MALRQNDLGNDDIKQLVRRLAIPSMLAQFVNVLYSIVDRMYIGNIKDVGEIALAGAGVCGPIVTLISSFAFLIGIGGAPLMAIRMGENNHEGAKKILANCFVMLLGLSATLPAAAIALREPMLMFFGASEQTFPYANSYLTYYVSGTVFAILTAGLGQFITCQGFANEAMLSTIIGAVMNIILDPIFILPKGYDMGLFNMPIGFDMGTKGAAIATVIGQIVACILAIIINEKKNSDIQLAWRKFRPKLHLIGRIYAIGFPSVIMMAIGSIMTWLMNIILITYTTGKETAATVFGVYFKLNSFVFMPVFGLNNGVIPILAYNYGAQKRSRMTQAIRVSLCYASAFMLIGTILFLAIPDVLLGFFNATETMLAIGEPALRIIASTFIVAGVCIVLGSVFQALGFSVYSMIVSLARQLLVLVPVAWALAAIGQRVGNDTLVWISFPVAEVMSAVVTAVLFIRLNKKVISQIPDRV